MDLLMMIAAILSMSWSALAAELGPQRRYAEGEVRHYAISGTHEMNGKMTSRYRARATAAAKKRSDGIWYEEIVWTHVDKGGEEQALPPGGPVQKLSLDPGFRSALPDLSKFDQKLFAPLMDLMTFYVDAQLAIKRGKSYVPYGKESSWAGGGRVIVGYDCIDFDVTLASAAAIQVDHVPPPAGCARVPADWMRKPVSDSANNWYQVEKEGETYEAGSGKETFRADITLDPATGAIESATLDNPVHIEERTCKDAALARCGKPKKTEILRKIVLARERP